MKFLTTVAAATLLTASVASANDLGSTGITWNVDTDAVWNFDAEALSITTTPGLGYEFSGVNFTLETNLDIYSNEEFALGDTFDNLTFDIGASYALGSGMSVGIDTKIDDEFEFTGTEAIFSFIF